MKITKRRLQRIIRKVIKEESKRTPEEISTMRTKSFGETAGKVLKNFSGLSIEDGKKINFSYDGDYKDKEYFYHKGYNSSKLGKYGKVGDPYTYELVNKKQNKYRVVSGPKKKPLGVIITLKSKIDPDPDPEPILCDTPLSIDTAKIKSTYDQFLKVKEELESMAQKYPGYAGKKSKKTIKEKIISATNNSKQFPTYLASDLVQNAQDRRLIKNYNKIISKIRLGHRTMIIDMLKTIQAHVKNVMNAELDQNMEITDSCVEVVKDLITNVYGYILKFAGKKELSHYFDTLAQRSTANSPGIVLNNINNLYLLCDQFLTKTGKYADESILPSNVLLALNDMIDSEQAFIID